MDNREDVFVLIDASAIEGDEYTFYIGTVADEDTETVEEGDIVPAVNERDEITEVTVTFSEYSGASEEEIEAKIDEVAEELLESYDSDAVDNFGYELVKKPTYQAEDGTFKKVVALTPIKPYLGDV